MKLVLWNSKVIFINDDIAKSYEKIHGEAIKSKEAEALLLTSHINADSCLPNADIKAKLEEIMSEDITVNRQLASVNIRQKAKSMLT